MRVTSALSYGNDRTCYCSKGGDSDFHRGLHLSEHDVRQLDDLQRELEDLRLENRIFKSYYERHASEVAAEVEDDKRKTNRQRRRQLPTVLTIEQKVEIGAHEQEVAHKDVSSTCVYTKYVLLCTTRG